MTDLLPDKSVYYYECSRGSFRLYYYIPPGELEKLVSKRRISENVLEDFPDGVDLGCTDTNFKVFAESYGYRPDINPKSMQQAFFTILSTTRDWKNFRGTGFISHEELESQLETVSAALAKDRLLSKSIRSKPETETLRQRRRKMKQKIVQQKQEHRVLQKLAAKNIDPKRTLAEQRVSHSEMIRGKRAEDVFTRLHLKQPRGGGNK